MLEEDVMEMNWGHTAVLGGKTEMYEKGPMNARLWIWALILPFILSEH